MRDREGKLRVLPSRVIPDFVGVNLRFHHCNDENLGGARSGVFSFLFYFLGGILFLIPFILFLFFLFMLYYIFVGGSLCSMPLIFNCVYFLGWILFLIPFILFLFFVINYIFVYFHFCFIFCGGFRG